MGPSEESGKWIAATGGSRVYLFDIEKSGQVQRTVLDDDSPGWDRFAFSENDQYLVASGN